MYTYHWVASIIADLLICALANATVMNIQTGLKTKALLWVVFWAPAVCDSSQPKKP